MHNPMPGSSLKLYLRHIPWNRSDSDVEPPKPASSRQVSNNGHKNELYEEHPAHEVPDERGTRR